MHKTFRAAALALGTCALAGLSANANAAYTFSNDNPRADGSITGTYPQFTITGSDNGAGENTTFYTQTFAASAIVSFSWQYASLDSSGLGTYDPAGWVVTHAGTSVETQLSVDADTSDSGTTSVTVLAGDTFGFYVYTIDSMYGPGMLAINEDLSLPPPPPPPPPPPAIPEPQNAVLMMAGLAALFAAVRRRKSD
jgi:hypothetical protein